MQYPQTAAKNLYYEKSTVIRSCFSLVCLYASEFCLENNVKKGLQDGLKIRMKNGKAGGEKKNKCRLQAKTRQSAKDYLVFFS